MPTTDDASRPAAGGLALFAAIALQDQLNMVGCDLERLQRLLGDACDTLLASFRGAHAALSAGDTAAPGVSLALEHLGAAVVALQFQDIASQLLAHSQRRLRAGADRLAREALPDDDSDCPGVIEEAQPRPNPVTQDEMDAGSVELF